MPDGSAAGRHVLFEMSLESRKTPCTQATSAALLLGRGDPARDPELLLASSNTAKGAIICNRIRRKRQAGYGSAY